MDFRDYANTETSAFVDRLIAAAEASAAQLRVWADGEIGKLRAEADGLREQAESLRKQTDSYREATESLRQEAGGLREQVQRLDGETGSLRAELEAKAAHAASLAAELEPLKQTRREAEEHLLQVDAARAHTEAELRAVREQLDASRADLARLSDAFKTEVSRTAAVQAEAAQNARTQEAHEDAIRELETRHDAVLRQIQAQQEETVRGLQTQLDAAQRERQEQTDRAAALAIRLDDVDGTLSSWRRQVADANAIADAVHEGLAVMRARSQRVMTLLRGAVTALNAPDAAATAADVFSTVVRLLAAEFPRVAIFRLQGNHLQGELAAGIDDAIDITKLVIPLGLDSVISRAAAGGTLEQATAEQIAASRPPFGGTPASALAAPLTFQGETLAVVYADSDEAPNDAHAAFAGVLVSQANVLLSRLAQELQTTKVLREYARMLLHEAEQMYVADVEEGRPEADRLRRLHDTVEFGRQLYDQRAALESSSAAGLLEDEIAALIRAQPATPFGSGLAAALGGAAAERTAS